MHTVVSAITGLAGPWAYLLIGGLALAESAALVGLIIPGETALLLGGFLAQQERVSLPLMLAIAVLGAVLGDSIGYEIGRHAGPPLRRSRLGRRVGPARWDRAETYLSVKGGRAVLAGRWVGVLRALVPAVAGMARMPYRRFLVFNVAGAVVWASAFVLLGYGAGSSYQHVGAVAGRASLLLLVAAIVIALIVLAARWASRHPDRLRAATARVAGYRVVAVPRAILVRGGSALIGRNGPGGASGWILAGGLAGLMLVGIVLGDMFGAVVDDVRTGQGVAGLDRPVLNTLADHREGWATGAMKVATLFGHPFVVAFVLLAAAAWVYRRTRRRRVLALAVIALGGAELLETAVKAVVHRARPPLHLRVPGVAADGSSFPSGHATLATVGYGAAAVLLAAASTAWAARVAIATFAILAAVAVGASRMYLGVHWASDVLAGWLIGATWLAVLALATAVLTGRWPRRPGAPSRPRPHPSEPALARRRS